MQTHLDEIIRLSDDPDALSTKAMQRITLALTRENLRRLDEVVEVTRELRERQEEAEDWMVLYPSLLWLLRHKPKETVAVMFLFLSLAGAIGGQYGFGLLLKLLWDYLGVPTP